MFAEEKLNAVRNYLRGEFPSYAIHDQFDHDRYAQTFRLTQENKIHLVTVSREFLDDHSTSEILKSLERCHISQYFQKESVARVVVTNSGVKLEK